jgi:hypothetical protein
MGRLSRWITAAIFGAAALSWAPREIWARPSAKVEWTRVEVPKRDDSARLEKMLRTMLKEASRKADFGKTKQVSLRARVVQFSSVQEGDVQRVSCTILGRVERGPSARSRISYGGSPLDRDKLEKEVLRMVANAVVTRLAEIVRSRADQKATAVKADE